MTSARQPRLPRGFHYLLTGVTVTLTGSQVTVLALPLTAIGLLGAGPFESGVLLACSRAPYLVCGPIAGVVVDRLPHRPLLIAANTVMALTLATVPLAALTGHLAMGLLYAVAVVVGTASVLADVAYLSCVPTVVAPSQLVRAQSRLELGHSVAMALGPPLAGWLIGAFSAPTALLADTASFVVAAAVLPFVVMNPVEPAIAPETTVTAPTPSGPRRGFIGSVLAEAVEGALFVLKVAPLRAATLSTGTFIFCYNAYTAVFLLYLTKRLGFSAGVVGMVLAVGAAGAMAGALVARPLARLLGLGRVLVVAVLVSAAGALVTPFFGAPGWTAVAAVAVSQFVLWAGQQVYNVHQVPLRYTLAPPSLHGRVNASIRTMVWGLAPLGALLGGIGGAWFGTRATLLLSGVLSALATVWIVRSPLWTVRTAQLTPEPAAPAAERDRPTLDAVPTTDADET
ncbi:MFS transporter [Streptomyces sp. NPDC087212]|uniref:MFS transporter n=1 Tax=Streptomyces sp. NPDC087212 TaxID=3365766 RepID=UPI00381C0D8D